MRQKKRKKKMKNLLNRFKVLNAGCSKELLTSDPSSLVLIIQERKITKTTIRIGWLFIKYHLIMKIQPPSDNEKTHPRNNTISCTLQLN